MDIDKICWTSHFDLFLRQPAPFEVLLCGDAIYVWNACRYDIWYSYGL